MNKCSASEKYIIMYCDKRKQFLKVMNHTHRFIRSLKITDRSISKTKDDVYNIMLLWRKLKLPITPSTHLFESHIVYQIKKIVGGLADKSEDHIERDNQDGKRSERIYCALINFQQSQISQLKNNDMIINP